MYSSKEKQGVKILQQPASRLFYFLASVVLVASMLFVISVPAQAASCSPLLKQQFNRLQDGVPVDLCQYSGKVVLVVNTASYCGFTQQYGGLEKLYADYKDRGLVILGFPANDFANQEPGTNKEVANFCFRTYGVAFPMFEKSHVVGSGANGFYKALAQRTGVVPQWNFHKYLISRDGKQVLSFASSVEPKDAKLAAQINRMLKAGSTP